MGYYTTRGYVVFDGDNDRFTMDQVIERIQDLESCNVMDLDDDEIEELEALQAFLSSAETPRETHTETEFIADHAFADHMKDCVCESDTSRWPYTHIDWDRACEELKYTDYYEVELMGTIYWYRNLL